MIVGSAYAWYAVYSGIESYMDKAVDTFGGLTKNAWFGDGRHMWECNRYMAPFLRWYRAFYNTACGYSAIEQCITQPTCEAAGGNWTGEYCQHAAVSNLSATGLSAPSPSSKKPSLWKFATH